MLLTGKWNKPGVHTVEELIRIRSWLRWINTACPRANPAIRNW